ncbi:MAG: L28 family ribosomal protein [Candidatus Shapirobacteria bacterium]
MARCKVCGKGTTIGRTSKHHRGVTSRQFSNRAPKKSRTFKANIQKTTVRVGGLKLKLRLCANCLKKMKKEAKKEAVKAPQTSKNQKKK